MFAQEEPFGAWWENWQSAIVAYMLAAVNTPKNKRRPKLSDFMYKGPRATRKARDQNLRNAMRALEAKADKVIDLTGKKDNGKKN